MSLLSLPRVWDWTSTSAVSAAFYNRSAGPAAPICLDEEPEPVQHDVQDAYDAYRRALASDRPSWHPMLAAIEGPSGVWRMTAQFKHYGWIRLVRRGPEVGYKAETEDGQIVGYFISLRAAASGLHERWIASHSCAGGINGG